MPTPERHALLSASSAHQWMHCTPSARLGENAPDKTSEYAEEGRLAHSIAELKLRKKFEVMTQRTYTARLNKLKKDHRYSPELDTITDTYLEYVTELAMIYPSRPAVVVEQQVEFSRWVPEGFGTSDCIILGSQRMDVVDFKAGRGVAVDAERNPQMMLYVLGALEAYSMLYDIQDVRLHIVQPRVSSTPSTWETTAENLLKWADAEVKPLADLAWKGEGETTPGDWCRFCRVKAQCRARADQYAMLEDFAAIPGPLLSDAEIGERLTQAKGLTQWAKDLEAYALAACLEGRELPGWKVVEGRRTRAFDDPDAAFGDIVAAGVDEAMLYERRPLTLSQIEKIVGKTRFAEIAGAHIVKSPGKPTLAPASDKREPYAVTTAAQDFGLLEKE